MKFSPIWIGVATSRATLAQPAKSSARIGSSIQSTPPSSSIMRPRRIASATVSPWLKSTISVIFGPMAFFTARSASRSAFASGLPRRSLTAENPSATSCSASFARVFYF